MHDTQIVIMNSNRPRAVFCYRYGAAHHAFVFAGLSAVSA